MRRFKPSTPRIKMSAPILEAVLDGQNRLLYPTEFDAEGEERHRQRRERATTGPPAHSRIPVARDGRPLGRPDFGHVCKPPGYNP